MTVASWGATPQVVAGANYTITLRSDGTLWASGLNVFGQLGDGSLTSRNTPVRIGTARDWAAVATGNDHTLALKADGSLWAWGSNQFGQVGDGSLVNRTQPVRIGLANDWKAIATGTSSSFALKADGTLWTWGRNDRGQLGSGDTAGTSNPVPVLNIGQSSYVAVSAGGEHTLALQADGTLWAWGSNQYGQIAQSTVDLAPNATPVQIGIDSDWRTLSAGGIHSLALKTDGTLWGWGDNHFGQLGQGSTDPNPHNTPVPLGTDRDWAALSAGNLHTLVVKRDGSLWAWGDNSSGQLGDGTATGRDIPLQITAPSGFTDIIAVAAGTTHSLAAKANGELYGWGDNGTGQLGNATNAGSFSPIPVATDVVSWVGTEPGGAFTVARRSDGTLWTWGDNASGQLGDNNSTFTPRLTPAVVGNATNWTAQSAGWSHTVALRADGTLWTWGDNTNGQLGDGTTANRQAPAQIIVTQPESASNNWKAIAAGDFHTLALKADGTLWVFGDNSSGQLGDGTGSSHSIPVQVVTGNPGNFDSQWAAIAAGGSHSLAIQADGTLWVWGDNSFGQLGNPSLSASGVNTPRQLVDFAPPTNGFNSSWIAVAAGLSHSLALQADGTLWSWGSNFSGQLGNGDTTLPNPPDRTAPVQVINSAATPYVAMSAGDSYSVARQADGTLWSWGSNTSGQLGNAASDSDPLNPVQHSTPVRENTVATNWIAAVCGGSHTMALKADGSLLAWGNNANGQLGDGTTTNSSLPHLSVTVTLVPDKASPQVTGTAITLTAAIQGGNGSYEYRFWINSGTGYVIVKDYSAANTLVWTPAASGAYDVLLDVRTVGSTALRDASTKLFYYQIVPAAATGVSLTPNLASPQTPGTPVTFTALGQGGSGAYEYRFWLNSGAGYTIVQAYSATNTYVWTPATTGNYDILVDVRNAGSTVVRDALTKLFYYQIVPAAATGVSLTPSLASPQAPGTPITFTASGQGGSGAYEYRFWLNSGSGYTIVQDYSSTSTLLWTPASAGNYDILVDVRSAGSTAFREALTKIFYYQVQ